MHAVELSAVYRQISRHRGTGGKQYDVVLLLEFGNRNAVVAAVTNRGAGDERDACFAQVVSVNTPYYWPAPEMLRTWLAQWPEWERAADPPSWFTEEWQRQALGVVPPELLPEEVRPRSTVT